MAKGFDTFCPLSSAVPTQEVANPHHLELVLMVNGQIRQQAPTAALIYTMQEIVAQVSSLMTLEPGDLILTGPLLHSGGHQRQRIGSGWR